MARGQANIQRDIWTSQEFRDLTESEQRLYFFLLSNDTLSYAGVGDWRPKRLKKFAADSSAEHMAKVGESLQSKSFILIDEDTEEVLIRSFLKHDGVLKQPRLTVSMANAYGGIASEKIRAVLIYELRKLSASGHDWEGLKSQRVQNLMRERAAPIEDFISPSSSPTFGPNPDHGLGLRTEANVGPSDGQGLGLHTSTLTKQVKRMATPGSSEKSQDGPTAGSSEDLTEASSDEFSLLEPEDAGPSIEDQFEEFWSHWPRKVKKPKALDAFVKAVKEKRATAETIIDAARAYAASPDLPEKRFIPHPASWLNADQWNDLDADQQQPANPERPTLSNPGRFTNWSSDDYRPWEDRPNVVEAQGRIDKAREEGEEPTDDDLRTVAGPPGS